MASSRESPFSTSLTHGKADKKPSPTSPELSKGERSLKDIQKGGGKGFQRGKKRENKQPWSVSIPGRLRQLSEQGRAQQVPSLGIPEILWWEGLEPAWARTSAQSCCFFLSFGLEIHDFILFFKASRREENTRIDRQ